MTEPYTLMGSQMSPYSVKVQSYLNYKAIPFVWEERSVLNRKKFKQHAVIPLIPLLLRADGNAVQDSTRIIEAELEPAYPQPSVYPEEPAARFLCELLEEHADEWVVKLMFFQRWRAVRDQKSAADRLARLLFGVTWWGKLAQPLVRPVVARRMMGRLPMVGATEANIPLLQRSWEQLVADLEAHLASRQYLFGGRPSLADFSLYGQMVQAFSDPTAGDYIRGHGLQLQAWIERMKAPVELGEFEALDALFPSLAPVLENNVARHFLPWSEANAVAWEAGDEQFTVTLEGERYQQKTFKFPGVSRAALVDKFDRVKSDRQTLAALRKVDCLRFFTQEAVGQG
jgi:glutathione S-transferase